MIAEKAAAPFSVADMLSDIRRNQHHKPGEP
jgi:hypothetical protein